MIEEPTLEPTEESVEDEVKLKANPMGGVTVFGLWLLVSLFAFMNDSYRPALNNLRLFVTGDALHIAQSSVLSLSGLAYMAAFVSMALPLALAVVLPVTAIIGKAKTNPEHATLGKSSYTYLTILGIVTVEELYARLLFLGAGMLLLPGTTWFYVLFLIGNGTWAAVHLLNYKVKSDRNPLRVLTQFVTGVLFTVVFLSHGFMAALLVHIAFDMLLFSGQKLNKFSYRDVMNLWFNALIAALSLLSLGRRGHDVTDMTQWLKFDSNFAINGWTTFDYTLGVLFVTCTVTAAANLLQFDTPPAPRIKNVVVNMVIGTLVVVGLNVGLYWFVGLFTQDVGWRLIVAGISVYLIVKTTSSSSMTRIFWSAAPQSIVLLCGILAIGSFFPVLLLVVVVAGVSTVEYVILRLK